MHEEVVMGAAHPAEAGTPVFRGVGNAVDGGMMAHGSMMVTGTTAVGGVMAGGQQEGFVQQAMHTVGTAFGVGGQGGSVASGQPVMMTTGGSASAMQPAVQGGSVMSVGQAGGGSTFGQPPVQQGTFPAA
mmetsp:Transcript_114419/g.227685  ORF Transcript_114419/g.227685 Transcript_114419/m.227685 type:complete len:130 (-) Transcript_114419:154-543(-)